MTPTIAGTIAKRGRKLLRRGMLTHRQLALLDCLIWSCRAPGSATARVSYTRLQRLAHMARETIARGLARLEELGLLRRTRVRLRVAWGGGVASRQGVSIYTLMASTCTEFATATVNQGTQEIRIQEGADRVTRAAQSALTAMAARRTQMLHRSFIQPC